MPRKQMKCYLAVWVVAFAWLIEEQVDYCRECATPLNLTIYF